MINLDMVGRLDEEPLSLAGVKTGDLLAGWVERANAELRLPLKQEQGLNANSDHDPFYKRGVPVLVPFTGLHEDYHRPSDDVERIDTEGLEFAARVAYALLRSVDVICPYLPPLNASGVLMLYRNTRRINLIWNRSKDAQKVLRTKSYQVFDEWWGSLRDPMPALIEREV